MAKKTTDHEKIREWVEQREGKPSVVKSTHNDSNGILQINFPDYRGKNTLEDISWDEFFNIFDKRDLSFVYQEKTAGGEPSHFFKFISQKKSRVSVPH
ncbi:MAG: hypothetical protein AB1650_08640 [Candidatus Omnitrophota bacterium]